MNEKTVQKSPNALDYLSGGFSFIGFLLNKADIVIPNPGISNMLKITGSVCYIASYGLWMLASIFYPEYKRSPFPLGLLSFKKQNLLSGSIGFISSMLSIIGTFVSPQLFIASLFLIVISNLIWTISEIQKKEGLARDEKSPLYKKYSQLAYIGYASFVTLNSLVISVSFLLLFIFPQHLFVISLVTVLVSVLISILSLAFYVVSYEPDKAHHHPRTTSIQEELSDKKLSNLELIPMLTNQTDIQNDEHKNTLNTLNSK